MTNTFRVRQHLWWVVPILLGGVAVLALMTPLWSAPTDPMALGVAQLLAALVPLVVITVVIFLIVGGTKAGRRAYRSARHRAGKFTQTELTEQGWWNHAVELRAALLRHHTPAQIDTWDVIPQHGEIFFYDIPVNYARYYGMDVSYSRSGGFFFGSPLFVVAGLAATAVSNSVAKRNAMAAAREQWRERQSARMLVTNQRLAIQVGGRWLNFPYHAMTAVYPAPASWSLVCQFPDTQPLMISGLGTPAATMIVLLMTHGETALERHPDIQSMARVGQSPLEEGPA